MLKIIIFICGLISLAFANGELSILHNPDSITFKGKGHIESDAITEIFSAALGYAVENPSGWNGFYINEPFNMPKAVVVIILEGIEHLKIQQGKGSTYNIVGSSTGNAIDNLASIVDQQDTVMDIDLDHGYDALSAYPNKFSDVKPKVPEKTSSSLKPKSYSEDKLFLQQMDIMHIIADRLDSFTSKPTLLLVRVSLGNLLSVHNSSSVAIDDALKMVSSATQKLAESSNKAFDGNVLIAVVASKSERNRRDLSSRAKRAVSVPPGVKLAKNYSADYPIIFNIILWFGVAFAFSLLAICIVIGTMDPGRDSIIYRMTLNRMKKEN